jgi:23S rRNA G2069 N7-methylase RlmK/C1962 C5-methylase RlmI
MTENELPIIADGETKSSPFLNCIRNNYKHLRKWAKRTQTNCFRIYEKEIAHYPLAIDFYANRFCVHFFARSKEEDEPSDDLIREVELTLKLLFGTSCEDIYWRTRKRSKATRQYEKIGNDREYFSVMENGVKFQVNLVDYLDTGLFLDHRETRKLVALEAKDKRVLNLFAYTCSFSVHAAMAGASFTKSVDMSNTYTDWGRRNFEINGLPEKNNPIVRADCLKFLTQEKEKYDLIVIDPPTISRSKKMEDLFDIQRDYVFLIQHALKLLLPGGCIYFSTNSRKFTFDGGLFPACQIKEISSKTLPIDFKDSKIHRCWKLKKD